MQLLFKFYVSVWQQHQALPKRKRNYNVALKLQVVESAEGTSKREAGKKIDMDRKRVQQWKLQKGHSEDTGLKKRLRMQSKEEVLVS